MKKTLLAAAIVAFSFASTANAGVYAEGDIGLSQTRFSAYSGLNKTKVEPRVAVGYKKGNIRVAGDYTHHGKFSGRTGSEDTSVKIRGLGATVYYDFNSNSNVEPYVGARVSANHVKITNHRSGYFRDASETKVGYGVVAGAKYKLDQNWYANGGVEYNRLGSFEDTNLNNYGAKVGVGYEF